MRDERVSILNKINEIERTHCYGCQLKLKKENKQKACATFCEIGREIVEIARPLTQTRCIEEPEKKLVPHGGKTKIIMELYDKGKRQAEIMNITGFSKGTVYSTIHRVKHQRMREKVEA